MASKEEIFQAFVDANEMTCVGADFATQQKKYDGLGYNGRTQSDLMKTIEFAGFIDGYVGNPHKEKGPRGALDSENALEEVTDQLVSRAVLDLSGGMKEGIKGMTDKMKQTGFEDHPQAKYDRQYQLGNSMRN